jgi:hypothetical protein
MRLPWSQRCEISVDNRSIQWRHALPGVPDHWKRYLADVRATHGRKYKLMGLLKEL